MYVHVGGAPAPSAVCSHYLVNILDCPDTSRRKLKIPQMFDCLSQAHLPVSVIWPQWPAYNFQCFSFHPLKNHLWREEGGLPHPCGVCCPKKEPLACHVWRRKWRTFLGRGKWGTFHGEENGGHIMEGKMENIVSLPSCLVMRYKPYIVGLR